MALYSHAHDVNDMLVHGNTCIGPDRGQNGHDWPHICTMYHPRVVALYETLGFPYRNVSFFDALNVDPMMRRAQQEVGQFAALILRIEIRDAELHSKGANGKPWLNNRKIHKRIVIKFDREWSHWREHLYKVIAKHAGLGEAGLSIELYNAATNEALPNEKNALAAALQAAARGRGIVAVVNKTSSLEKAVIIEGQLPAYEPRKLGPIWPTRLVASAIQEEKNAAKPQQQKKSRHGKHIAAPLLVIAKPPKKPLSGIASKIAERIGEELVNGAKSASGSGRDRRHSVAKVQSAMTDRNKTREAVEKVLTEKAIYGSTDPQVYWHARNINIAEVIDMVAHKISSQLDQINSDAFFASSSAAKGASKTIASSITGGGGGRSPAGFREDIAKRVLTTATINCGLWDSFMDMIGMHGTHDDGGHDLGPCAPISLCREKYGCGSIVKACSQPHHVDACEPRVHFAPRHILGLHTHHGNHHYHHGGENEDVAIPRVKIHVGPRHKKPKSKAGADFSESSDDESRALEMAWRGHGHRHPDSSPGSDSSSSGDEIKVAKQKTAAVAVPTHTPSIAASITVNSAVVAAHIDETHHSHFLGFLRKHRNCDRMSPCIVVCPNNDALDADNMRFLASVPNPGSFLRHYVCTPHHLHKHHGPICAFKDLVITAVGKVVLVGETAAHATAHAAATAAHWIIHVPSHTLCLVAKAAHGAAAIPAHLAAVHPHLYRCRGFPDHVLFLPVNVLHKHVPTDDKLVRA